MRRSSIMYQRAKGKEQAVLFVGDVSYADHYPFNDQRRWDTWGRFLERSMLTSLGFGLLATTGLIIFQKLDLFSSDSSTNLSQNHAILGSLEGMMDWALVHRVWDKWASNYIGSSGSSFMFGRALLLFFLLRASSTQKDRTRLGQLWRK
ncbi:hypothetical protein AAC387_Pa04g1093 [Persea americana]